MYARVKLHSRRDRQYAVEAGPSRTGGVLSGNSTSESGCLSGSQQVRGVERRDDLAANHYFFQIGAAKQLFVAENTLPESGRGWAEFGFSEEVGDSGIHVRYGLAATVPLAPTAG